MLSGSKLEGMNASVIKSFAHKHEATDAIEQIAREYARDMGEDDERTEITVSRLAETNVYSFCDCEGCMTDIYINESEIEGYFPTIVAAPEDFGEYYTSEMTEEEMNDAAEMVADHFCKIDSSWEIFWECVRYIAEERLGLTKKSEC